MTVTGLDSHALLAFLVKKPAVAVRDLFPKAATGDHALHMTAISPS